MDDCCSANAYDPAPIPDDLRYAVCEIAGCLSLSSAGAWVANDTIEPDIDWAIAGPYLFHHATGG